MATINPKRLIEAKVEFKGNLLKQISNVKEADFIKSLRSVVNKVTPQEMKDSINQFYMNCKDKELSLIQRISNVIKNGKLGEKQLKSCVQNQCLSERENTQTITA